LKAELKGYFETKIWEWIRFNAHSPFASELISNKIFSNAVPIFDCNDFTSNFSEETVSWFSNQLREKYTNDTNNVIVEAFKFFIDKPVLLVIVGICSAAHLLI